MFTYRPFLKYTFKKELPEFFKNVGLMAQSGIPLNEAMEVLSAQARSATFKKFLENMRTQLEQGSSFSRALTPYREEVGDLVLNVIRAGEINGTLDANFQYLAILLDRRAELSQKLSSAMLYPEIVLTMVFFIGGGVSMFVLPKLIPLFKSLNVTLPLATQILLRFAQFLQVYGIQAFFGTILVVGIFGFSASIRPIRSIYHAIALKIPFFGRLVRNYQLALFSQLFGTLFRSGLTIREALTASAEAMTNLRYQAVLFRATKRLSTGVPLASILEKEPAYFPQNVVALIAVGERSGKLEESFAYLASYYDREVEVQTKRLPVILEPVLLVMIGLVVLYVALAIISPIYEITKGIQPRGTQ